LAEYLLTAYFEYPVITFRNLSRAEIPQVWSIDRSEIIENIYFLEDGEMVLKPDTFDVPGWPPGEPEKNTPAFYECFDRGGWFYGVFDDDQLAGVAILDSQFIGKEKDTLQLSFLHISQAYRGTGLGKQLFELARAEARKRGAKKMYVSATPSENTIHFYFRRGCVVTPELDPELFALEPEDIHLICDV